MSWKKKAFVPGMAAALLFTVFPCTPVFAEEKGDWGMSENGKYWNYFSSPGTPVEDEWIEDNGKEYYVDSSGRMKTGWVTDKRDKTKYYLGEDGAKCFNCFTPDDHYVGPEGTVFERYDKYRKAVKKELNSLLKDQELKKLPSDQPAGFVLADLNGDDYQDVVAVDRADTPSRVLLVKIWDSGEQKFTVSMEDNLAGASQSWLTYNRDQQCTWLSVSYGDDWNRDLFQLKNGGARFDNPWHFTVEMDDWGGPVYYVNGIEAEKEEWEADLAQAGQDAGEPWPFGYTPLREENISPAVDRVLEGESLLLWME